VCGADLPTSGPEKGQKRASATFTPRSRKGVLTPTTKGWSVCAGRVSGRKEATSLFDLGFLLPSMLWSTRCSTEEATTTPAAYDAVAANVMRLLANAVVELAALKVHRRL
jgi:hypothetical protein